MALSGLDIYKMLPKTNCRECGFATCLAFAMQLAKKAVSLDKCPTITSEAKKTLEASSLPPIRLVSAGTGERTLTVGDETVMFRHEEKFRHPCGIGFIIDDSLPAATVREKLAKINALRFERVGQVLEVDLVAIRQTAGLEKFLSCVRTVADGTGLTLVLMSQDPQALEAALKITKDRRPLVYGATRDNAQALIKLAQDFQVPVVVTACDLDSLSKITAEFSAHGIKDLVLDTAIKPMGEKIWDLTQARRIALKKSNRNFGYPVLVTVSSADPLREVLEAGTYIAKYAGIILMSGLQAWQALALLTLRQNIYTDPQKPLQIEPKVYSIGKTTDASPILVTTNFSLTYYTVLGEVEASKVPAHIMSVDTEGMSVLTAWAAEKFNAGKITDAMRAFGVSGIVQHKNIVIPGYVAMMSGDLEEQSGWRVIVGPKEAAGIPSFLKKL